MVDLHVVSLSAVMSLLCLILHGSEVILHVTLLSKQAVCCNDKLHCCPEGTTCDIGHMKCVSPSTKKELPMWAKFPARIREDWENQKGQPVCSDHNTQNTSSY